MAEDQDKTKKGIEKITTLYAEKKKPLFQINSKEDIEKFATLVEYLREFYYYNPTENADVEIYYGEDDQLYVSYKMVYKIDNLVEFLEDQKDYINENLEVYNDEQNQKKTINK